MVDSLASLLGATVHGRDDDYDFDTDGPVQAPVRKKKVGRPRRYVKPSVTLSSPQPELFPLLDLMPEGSVLVAGHGGFRTLVQCEGCEKLMHERADGSRTCSAICVQAAQRKERERIAAEKHEASDKVYRASRHLDGVGEEEPKTRLAESIRAGKLAPTLQEKTKGGWRELPPLNPASMVWYAKTLKTEARIGNQETSQGEDGDAA